MGTSGLLGFIIRGVQRHAAYNHYDSYPSYLRQNTSKFIRGLTPQGHNTMARRLREITWVDRDSTPSLEIQHQYQRAGFADLSVSNKSAADWYCLLHKTQGAAALPAIYNGQLKHMAESVDLLDDCDWAYFVDFENKKLETWCGGEAVDVATFEKLVKEGDGYMDKLLKDDHHRGEQKTNKPNSKAT
ncbi:hypothetical protein GALMADRAFT_221968 [Galerina marginata CBS 339.88]|uniref:Uncharacterized protein n=1 Tax=Galerina marginata (strain CBS 339.88) TaxID=685588 RepID=A0A067TIB4_GALM3|nr:hypothetical protein GALMADRAFT_221968 [Galerina marginata CBS 339.88]